MAEILLVRHAKSYANLRDFTAFGNIDSPLVDRGIEQAKALSDIFKQQHGIAPAEYEPAVLASEYVRPQQTAEHVGFRRVHVHPIINESDFDRTQLGIPNPVLKHAIERWIPDETRERAERFVELIRSGDLGYQIFFTHGLFIAATLMHLSLEEQKEDQAFQHEFHETRGFIPHLATITSITI